MLTVASSLCKNLGTCDGAQSIPAIKVLKKDAALGVGLIHVSMTSVERKPSQDGAGYHGGASHFFQPERFMAPDFNAEQYVADVRRFVRASPFQLLSPSASLCS